MVSVRYLLILVLTFLSSSLAWGQSNDYYFDGSTANPGDWNDAFNWDRDELPSFDGTFGSNNAYVGHNDPAASPAHAAVATANISGVLTQPIIGDLRIGTGGIGGAEGTVNQSAGSLATDSGQWVFVGVDGPVEAPNTGTYNLTGSGQFTTTGNVYVGGADFGSGVGNSGTLTVADNARLDLGTGGNIHFGSGTANIGNGTQTGGTVTGNEAFIGNAGGSTGTYNMDAGTLTMNKVYVGQNGTDTEGTFVQTGGEVTVTDWLVVGRNGNAKGTYNMSGGSLFLGTDYLTVGEADGADGQMTVSNDASLDLGSLAVGRFGGAANGQFTVNGNAATISVAFNLQVGIDDGNMFLPSDSTGTLEFISSVADVSSIDVIGDVYLNDGSVTGGGNLLVNLSGAPTTGDIELISVGGSLFGEFAGLAPGALVPGSGGRTISYTAGDGNDIWLLEGSGLPLCDINGDGFCNVADMRDLYDNIALATSGGPADIDGSGTVDNDDIAAWLIAAGDFNGKVYLPGDADLDGSVIGGDFTQLASKFGDSGLPNAYWDEGNFNGNVGGLFAVGGPDFTALASNFGHVSVSAVPEPASFSLLLLALFGLMSFARRK